MGVNTVMREHQIGAFHHKIDDLVYESSKRILFYVTSVQL